MSDLVLTLKPCTLLSISCCIFSIDFMSVCFSPFHISHPYNTVGIIMVSYNLTAVMILRPSDRIPIPDSAKKVFFPFWHLSAILEPSFIEESCLIPRCIAWSVSRIKMSPIDRESGRSFLDLLNTIMLDLSTLISNRHLLAYV